MYREYGNIFAMSQLGADQIILCDPRAYDTVLRAEGKFPIGAAESVDTFVNYYRENNVTMGIKSTSHGPEWKEWRSQLDPDLYVAWQSYLPMIAKAASQISKVAGNEISGSDINRDRVKFADFISRSAFDMFYSVMYGESPQTTNSALVKPKDIEFVKASKTAFDLTGIMLTNPFEKIFQTDTFRKFNVNMDKVMEFGKEKTLEYARQVREESALVAEATTDEGAVEEGGRKCPVQALKMVNISLFRRLMERDIPDDELGTITGPMLMAGVDTTAYVMSWLYLNLASNPDVQTKLANELKSVLNGADITTAEQINSLPYLKACIRESHRLTPNAVVQAKTLEKDVDVVVDGKTYRANAGTRICLNLCAFTWDEKYVDVPLEYRPERFLADAIEARKGTPSEIVDHPAFEDGFGRGKRRCIGANVAKAEIVILAARLIQDWEITLVDPSQKDCWEPKQYLMLKAEPYPELKLTRRK
jgi:cytochrome P450